MSLVRSSSSPQLYSHDLADLLHERMTSALEALAPGTQRAYDDGLNAFADWFVSWLPHAPPQLAAALYANRPSDRSWWSIVTCLLRSGPLVASTVVETFRASRAAGKAPATVALRLAAIRCPFRVAYDNGIVSWQLKVRAPKVEPYRDTTGPGLDAVRQLFAAASKARKPLFAARDVAMLQLLFTCALRREEASALDVKHYDRAGRLWIRGKGKQERVPVTLPPDVRQAIDRYLAMRSPVDLDAPLLASHTPDNTRTGDGRLTGSGIYQRLQYLTRKAKLDRPARPHGLRHTAITAALDGTRDPRVVQRFSRHAKLETVMRYDDNRADLGGAVAVQLADLVRPKR